MCGSTKRSVEVAAKRRYARRYTPQRDEMMWTTRASVFFTGLCLPPVPASVLHWCGAVRYCEGDVSIHGVFGV